MTLLTLCIYFFFFFFQAEDGIRDYKVTGVQTCALPIWSDAHGFESVAEGLYVSLHRVDASSDGDHDAFLFAVRQTLSRRATARFNRRGVVSGTGTRDAASEMRALRLRVRGANLAR